MKRYTLLEMVQHVAKAIGADEITTIDESVEAQDITTLVLEVLEDICNRREWAWRKHHLRTGTPAGTDDVTSLLIPADCSAIEQVSYRADIAGSGLADFRVLAYLRPDEFLTLVSSRNLSAANVTTVTVQSNNVPIYVYNERAPMYYTMFEEGVIVCDAYDSAVDPTGLSAARSALLVTVEIDTATAAGSPTWVAPIPTKFFSLWLQEAKAAASAQLRKLPNERAEREARRTLVMLTEFDEQSVDARENKEVNHGRRYGY